VVATAADEVLLQKVKDAILRRLATGQGGAADVQDILDQAGVSTRNPYYSDAVTRTALTNAYAEGQDAEMATPALQELFPAWEYHAIKDGRERPHHGDRDGRLFPAGVRFTDVRGHDPDDTINCRCGHSPVSKFALRGRRVEEAW
jgi:SPP1 gp7 family putative phage head morphogenesis protein